MRRLRPILLGVAVLYLLAVAICAFIIETPVPTWAALLVWFVAGLLLGIAVRPARWWVALGFLWLGVAWVEAGQAVWLEQAGSAADVLLGCAATGLGVAFAMAVHRLRVRTLSARAVAAPRPR